MKPTEWLMGRDTGISSKAIFAVMTNTYYDPKTYTPVPYDPADFGRCHRLLERFPTWRLFLDKMPATYPAWAPYVPVWDELTALYLEEEPTGSCPRLYERLKGLKGLAEEAYEAADFVRTGPHGWERESQP